MVMQHGVETNFLLRLIIFTNMDNTETTPNIHAGEKNVSHHCLLIIIFLIEWSDV